MKEIKLTRGKVALIDDDDFEFINSFKWYATKKKYTFYAERSQHISTGKHVNIPMHRLILGVTKKTMKVDHVDENGLNNQKSNLRICTHAQNKRNVTKRITGTLSKYKGVTKHKRDNRWMAQIRLNYKNIFCGYFKDEREAAIAYNKAAIKYHGEFANLNVIK